MQEIKNCPICGSEAKLQYDDARIRPWRVQCSKEPENSSMPYLTKEAAIAEWNHWVDRITPPELAQATIRREILDEAARCVCGDRENEYGSPEDNFKLIAALWGDYLRWEITPVDVAMMMTMLKIARIKGGTMTRDSFVDAAGYIACGGEIAARMEGETKT